MILATNCDGNGLALVENPHASGRALWLNLVLTAHSTLREG